MSADLRGPLRELRARLARLDDLFGTFAREPVPLDGDTTVGGVDGFRIWQERVQALMQHVANMPVGKLRAALRAHVVHPVGAILAEEEGDLLRTRPYQDTETGQTEVPREDMRRRARLLLQALSNADDSSDLDDSSDIDDLDEKDVEEQKESPTGGLEELQRILRSYYCP